VTAKRLISPATNAPGLGAAAAAVFAAAVMIYNVVRHHGVINVPVLVAGAAAAWLLYTRFKVTPVADPKDGNGNPLVAAPVPAVTLPPTGTVTVVPPAPEAHP
jgi:hypothetical protein